MSKESTFVTNVVSIANINQLVKASINKLGYEFIAPVDPAIQDEKISKAINQKLKQLTQ